MKTTVIYHRADYDGLFSAAVCAKFLPDAELIGWDFGDPLIPWPEGDGYIYIVDLPPDCLDGIVTRQTHRLIWIDHHKSSIVKWERESSLAGYRIDGVAACRLCWAWFTKKEQDAEDVLCGNMPITRLPIKEEFVDRKVSEPLALTLAGEYDVWDKHDPQAEAFQFGLTSGQPSIPQLIDLMQCTQDAEYVAELGSQAMRWQAAYAEIVCRERSYVREWEGRTFCILGSPHARNSMWFPKAAIPKECDALMCWRYDGDQVLFSLYHAPGHEEHDLSTIAVKYGGGGHRGACGFAMSLDDALAVIR